MAILSYLSKSMNGLENAQVDWGSNTLDNSNSSQNAKWSIVDMFRKNNINKAASIKPQQQTRKAGRHDLHRKSMPPAMGKFKLHAEDNQVDSTNGEGKLPRCVSFYDHRHCPNIDFGSVAESEHCSSSNDTTADCSSVVSELTLNTYSNEKAKTIKEAFFKHIREQNAENPIAYITSLSPAERESLLREIQVEEEQKFRRQYEIDKVKTKRNNMTEKSSPQAPQMIESPSSSSSSSNCRNTKTLKKKQSATHHRFSSFGSTATVKQGNKKKPALVFDVSTFDAAGLASKTSSSSDHREEVAAEEDRKHEPSFQPEYEEEAVPTQDEDLMTGVLQIGDTKKPHILQQEDEKEVASNSTSSIIARISDIVELKLLIANQQAAIDTLSSKLHNLEVINHRLELDASFYSTKSEGLLQQLLNASLSSDNSGSRGDGLDCRNRSC